MKKFYVFFLLMTLGVVGIFGQNNQNQLFFGTFKYDGFNNVTKAAYWVKRPEAKEVYEGGSPNGVKIITLTSDYFVRFVSSEHNPGDNNYIIFPKGEKIYEKDGKVYAAKCGNEIEFYMAINMFKIVHDTIIAKYPELIKNFPSNSVAVAKVEVNLTDSTQTVIATATATSGGDSAVATASVIIKLGRTIINPSVKALYKENIPDSTTWWQDHKKAIIVGSIVTLVISGILIADSHDWWKNKPQIVELRSMPPGLPSTEPAQQPGLNSDPRGMPSGLNGMNFNRNFNFTAASGQNICGITIKIPLRVLSFH